MDRLACDFSSFGIYTYSHVPPMYFNVLSIIEILGKASFAGVTLDLKIATHCLLNYVR
jgi:hypothetical protein